ncbi:Uncharacterised protein [Pseudomonas aeruginosa]|nr:Uncharacterised protein [Pseudomonas aeruginosa]
MDEESARRRTAPVRNRCGFSSAQASNCSSLALSSLPPKRSDRTGQRRAPLVTIAAAEQEIGAQDRQGQAHQLAVAQHLFRRTLQVAQVGDQLGVALRFGETAVILGASRRRRGAAGEEPQRRRATQLAQGIQHLAGEQGAEAVAEHRVGALADLVVQLRAPSCCARLARSVCNGSAIRAPRPGNSTGRTASQAGSLRRQRL